MTNIENVTSRPPTRSVPSQQRSKRNNGHTPFLGRLTVGQKLLLSGLVLGIPFAGLALSNISGYIRQLNTVHVQQAGQVLLDPARQALVNTQLTRLASTNFLNKTISKDDLDKQRQLVLSNLDTIIQGADKNNFPNIKKSVTEARNSFVTLNEKVDNRSISVSESVAQFTNLLNDQIIPVFANISSDASLRTASDKPTAELALLLTETLPNDLPEAGSIVSGASAILKQIGGTGSIVPKPLHDNLQLRWDISNAAQTDSLRRIQRVSTLTPQLNTALTPVYEKLKSSGDNIFQPILKNALQTDKLAITPNDIQAALPAYVDGQFGGFQKAIQALGDLLRSRQASIQQQLLWVSLLTLLGLTLATALLVAITRAITRPLTNLTLASQRLTAGDFSVKVPITTQDELATLSRSFNDASEQLHANELRVQQEREEANRLQGNIGEFLDVTMDIAEGDLTKRGKVTEDVLGNVVDSINLMAEELALVLKDVQNASSSVTGGSRAMLSTTEQINEGTQMTAAEAARVAQQVQELTAAIRDMAQSAQTSAQTARQALLASQQGQEAVSGTLEGMQNVRREVQDIAKRVKGLGDRSLEIQEIVDTIGQIARQTNLLALNAAIEAAGAGEAGGRFTIVADEVRKLADTSGQATSRIAALIKNVQSEIQDVVVRVEEGTREVEQGYRVAGTAGERLREIGALSESSAKLAEQISEATQEQVQGIEQMGQAVAQINNIAQQSAQSVEQGRNAAEQLQQLANRLNASLSRFRLPS